MASKWKSFSIKIKVTVIKEVDKRRKKEGYCTGIWNSTTILSTVLSFQEKILKRFKSRSQNISCAKFFRCRTSIACPV